MGPQDAPTSNEVLEATPWDPRRCCWKAFVKYVFRISMVTLKEEEQAWGIHNHPQALTIF